MANFVATNPDIFDETSEQLPAVFVEAEPQKSKHGLFLDPDPVVFEPKK